ncbi:MAG: DUF4203 domain-containing protein [Chloroflexi bacterium]|nr:DUF4203 domain-containing protein [Chloroflexota bacterium]
MDQGMQLLQDIIAGKELTALRAEFLTPPAAYVLMMVGLVLCFVGYFVYRVAVALTGGVVGGGLVWLAAGTAGLGGEGLWVLAGGGALLVALAAWYFSPVVGFFLGSFVGVALGVVLWTLGHGLVVSTQQIPHVVLVEVVPALAFGYITVHWEKTVIGFMAIFLGSGTVAFGARFTGLPGELGADLAALALGSGLLLQVGFARPGRRRAAE